MAFLYVVLGLGDSGRREIVAHLDRFGLEDDTPATVVDAAELAGPAVLAEPPPPATDNTFLLPPGEEDPRPWLEAAAAWKGHGGPAIARIFTIIDCSRLAAHPSCGPWYDACLHFSDVILLGNREGAGNKWVRAYEKDLARRALPSLVAMVKKGGRVDHPAELLYPEPRRISLFFDEPEPEIPEWERFEVESDASADDEAEDALPGDAASDAYLARDENGNYAVTLPDARVLLALPLGAEAKG